MANWGIGGGGGLNILFSGLKRHTKLDFRPPKLRIFFRISLPSGAPGLHALVRVLLEVISF